MNIRIAKECAERAEEIYQKLKKEKDDKIRKELEWEIDVLNKYIRTLLLWKKKK